MKHKLVQKARELGCPRLANTMQTLLTLQERAEARKHRAVEAKDGEPISEQQFVRGFGSKVRNVRFSGRADYVGLTIRGDRLGFMVVRTSKGERRIRFIVKEDGGWHVAKKYIPVHHNDSIAAMQKGLLRNVA